MCLFSARLRDPGRPEASTAEVLTPDGDTVEITDPGLPNRLGDGIRLMRLHRGAFDSSPVSLIGTATVAHLCRSIDQPVDARRFRPNLVVETDEPFVENSWTGRTLRIGDAALRIDRLDKRCVMINVDPETGRSEPSMLRLVARSHGSERRRLRHRGRPRGDPRGRRGPARTRRRLTRSTSAEVEELLHVRHHRGLGR